VHRTTEATRGGGGSAYVGGNTQYSVQAAECRGAHQSRHTRAHSARWRHRSLEDPIIICVSTFSGTSPMEHAAFDCLDLQMSGTFIYCRCCDVARRAASHACQQEYPRPFASEPRPVVALLLLSNRRTRQAQPGRAAGQQRPKAIKQAVPGSQPGSQSSQAAGFS
jgi:hypothetical protein